MIGEDDRRALPVRRARGSPPAPPSAGAPRRSARRPAGRSSARSGRPSSLSARGRRSRSRQALVAIRRSQAPRPPPEGCQPLALTHNLTRLSCTTSSASPASPSIRQASAWSIGRCRSTSCSKAAASPAPTRAMSARSSGSPATGVGASSRSRLLVNTCTVSADGRALTRIGAIPFAVMRKKKGPGVAAGPLIWSQLRQPIRDCRGSAAGT